MAVKKKSAKKEESAVPTKAEAKETAPKKKAPKKASASAHEPAAATKGSDASSTPKKAAAKKAAAAPIKLTASQDEMLKKIGEGAEAGYMVGKKIEQRSIESLLTKKLIKKGAKDKESGNLRYHISTAGKKHLGSSTER